MGKSRSCVKAPIISTPPQSGSVIGLEKSAPSTANGPGLRIGIAHADAPEWIEVLTDLVAKARPQAEIELVENLGAVVGTHAGPGAVGFFWFQDE